MDLFVYCKKESMKKDILLLLVWLALGMIWADTVLLSPTGDGGFESGSTFALNGWATVGYGSYYNQNHYILGTFATPYAGSYCAYIGYRDNYNRYYWNSSGNATYSHLYRDVTLGSTAEPVVTLTFWYKINNPSPDSPSNSADNGTRGPSATDGDGFRVYLAPKTYTPTTSGYPSGAGVQQIGAWWYDGVTSWLDNEIYYYGFNARSWTRMVVAIPRDLVGQEKRLIFTWRNNGDSPHYVGALDNISLVSKPLPTNPRFVAEWEQARGACINWDYYNAGNQQGNKFGVPNGLIAALADTLPIFVHCDPDQVTACSNYLTGTVGLSTSQFFIRNYPTDSYWARDHAPWFIFHGDERSRARSVGITRFTYNRDRPWDDHIGIRVAEQENYPLFCMPLVHTGGNIMTDGNGAAMSTNLVLLNNDGTYDGNLDHVVNFDYTQDEINGIMQEYLGVEDYQIFQGTMTGDVFTINRMDTWCKLLDVDRVIIRRVPPSHSEYAATEEAAAQWQNKATSYQREALQEGKPGSPYGYKVFRVDTPNGNEPYVNSLIMNNVIYVPLVSNPPSATDLAAIEAYQNAMPSYIIQGYHGNTNDPWIRTDALHNRVGLLYDPEMIHIWHVPLWGEVPENEDVNLSINITSTHDLNMSTPVTHVSYRIWNAATGYSSWVDVPLTHVSGNNYTATIPETAFAAGDSILYVIRAKDVNGNEHDEPLNGKHDPFWLYVVAPTTTPVELSSFTCGLSMDGFVNLNWVTQSETGLLGYYVFRNTEQDYASAELISPLIPGTNTSQQQSYMYSDRDLIQEGTYYYWLTSNEFDGTVNLYGPVSIRVDNSGGSSVPPIEIVTGINKVYPNPFGSHASITYSVAKDNSPVRLSVYNLRGELVRDLVSGVQGKDTYTTTWDCRDQQGKTCGNGVYLMVLKAGNESYVKRTILIK